MKRVVISLISMCCLCSIFATNRALLIGIGQYKKGTGWNPLHGDADIELLSPLLKKRGFIVRTLTNEEATKNGIVYALNTLIKECKAGDKVYFHFSGHGQPIEDLNKDEITRFDQTMVPYDAGRVYIKNRYEGQNHFIDDEYSYYIHAIRKKLGPKGQLFIAIDACHSQGIERGEMIDSIDVTLSVRGTSDKFRFKGRRPNFIPPYPVSLSGGAKTYVVSACGKEERNWEYRTSRKKVYGSLSYCVYSLLESNANFDKWANYFEQKLYKRFDYFKRQHPTIKVYK